MSGDNKIHVLVMYENGIASFRDLSGNATITLGSDGNLKVPYGDHMIRFHRLAGTTWKFSGFRYRPDRVDKVGPLTSIEIADGHIQVLDANRNTSTKVEEFSYEIKIDTATGGAIWIDPVIENQSGEPPPGGGAE